jgi:CheY-like chemotaxis protein
VVRDTGAGISPEILPYVFDRFRQGDSSTTRAHGGLGLGLAIARSLVELHGGSIQAASSGVGLGTAIRVELPIGRVGQQRRSDGGVRDRSVPFEAAFEGRRILVVDDQPDERALLAAVLQQSGVEVRVAASVAEAKATLEKWRPDLIVSDIAMPSEDGYMLMRAVRGAPQLAHIPAVAVTAHARLEDREAALAAGFGAYVAKPIDCELLLRECADLLRSAPYSHRR